MRELPASDLASIHSQVGPCWDEFRGARIFFTGATGFVGTWLLESFLFANARERLQASAVVLTRDPARFARNAPHLAGHPDIQIHAGDVRSFDFPAGPFTHAIHGAGAAAAVPGEDELELLDTLVAGTRRVLEFSARAGVGPLLLVSSGAVYGRQPHDLPAIPEDYRGGPALGDVRYAYAEGKRVAEFLCGAYARRAGIQPRIARCFTFAGPHVPLEGPFAFGNFIRDSMAGTDIRIAGDGSAIRSYLYAADLAAHLWTILFRGETGRPYNVGSGEAVSIMELAQAVASAAGRGARVVRMCEPAPDPRAARYVPDVSRAARELGLTARVNLSDAIGRTLEWHGSLPARAQVQTT